MSPLRCPLCHAPLLVDDESASCAHGHRFDRARQGYLNLLPVQQKNSRNPGDDMAMVNARSEFLNAGFYAPLRDALSDLLAPLRPAQLLDSGCGEGWYTTGVSRAAGATVAFDISKSAIRRAARRDRLITWLVASSADMPLLDASVDAITAVFSPVSAAEAARALRPRGSLFVVAPDERHLWELRAALYAEVRPHRPERWLADLAPAFSLHSATRVQFRMHLGHNQAVNSLLKMTPYFWRAAHERRRSVELLPELSLHTDFRILRFVRSVEA